jgi:hypothetical protein
MVVPVVCLPQISASSGLPAAISTAVMLPSAKTNTPMAAPATASQRRRPLPRPVVAWPVVAWPVPGEVAWLAAS